MQKIGLIGLMILISSQISAQLDPKNIWNWPEDRATAEEKNVLYTDNLRSELYFEAIEPLEYLISVAPNLNPSLYINGAKIYQKVAESETDASKKLEYHERALDMYDLRIKYFNNEAEVMNRKALAAYKFFKSNKSKYADLKIIFDRTFELNGENVFDNNLIAYLDVVRRYKLSGGEIEDAEVLDIYAEISTLIDSKLKNGGNAQRLKSIGDNLDKVLAATVEIDCDFVEANLGPKLEANPEDTKLAKKIFQLMLTGKCTSSPLALMAAKTYHKAEPSFGLAKFIAGRIQAKGEVREAIQYYEEAIFLAEDAKKKGDIYLDMAKVYATIDKSKSRSYAFKAVGQDPQLKEAYTLVGNLYMSSYETCREGVSKVSDRAIYLAAFEMYNRAGDQVGMANAKAQFPSMEEIFNEGKELGDSEHVGCWVNETVQLDRRPAN